MLWPAHLEDVAIAGFSLRRSRGYPVRSRRRTATKAVRAFRRRSGRLPERESLFSDCNVGGKWVEGTVHTVIMYQAWGPRVEGMRDIISEKRDSMEDMV